MGIQWFPGHMAKARRLLAEQLQVVDVVIELADARIPLSSRNPILKELLGTKPRLLLLNKADLADESWTQRWLRVLQDDATALAVSATTGQGFRRIIPELERLASGQMAKLAAKGVRPRSMRIMVVGIPNIGKSTLINQLAGGAKAKAGNKPGVTRGNQWIRIHEKVELLDTPGLLWPKFEDPQVGLKLAATGAIKDEVFNQEELAEWLLEWLETHQIEALAAYQAKGVELTLEGIGRARGCLVQGGEVDRLKAAQQILRDFRQGRLGHSTLDRF